MSDTHRDTPQAPGGAAGDGAEEQALAVADSCRPGGSRYVRPKDRSDEADALIVLADHLTALRAATPTPARAEPGAEGLPDLMAMTALANLIRRRAHYVLTQRVAAFVDGADAERTAGLIAVSACMDGGLAPAMREVLADIDSAATPAPQARPAGEEVGGPCASCHSLPGTEHSAECFYRHVQIGSEGDMEAARALYDATRKERDNARWAARTWREQAEAARTMEMTAGREGGPCAYEDCNKPGMVETGDGLLCEACAAHLADHGEVSRG